jgi:hypothetical protein
MLLSYASTPVLKNELARLTAAFDTAVIFRQREK